MKIPPKSTKQGHSHHQTKLKRFFAASYRLSSSLLSRCMPPAGAGRIAFITGLTASSCWLVATRSLHAYHESLRYPLLADPHAIENFCRNNMAVDFHQEFIPYAAREQQSIAIARSIKNKRNWPHFIDSLVTGTCDFVGRMIFYALLQGRVPFTASSGFTALSLVEGHALEQSLYERLRHAKQAFLEVLYPSSTRSLIDVLDSYRQWDAEWLCQEHLGIQIEMTQLYERIYMIASGKGRLSPADAAIDIHFNPGSSVLGHLESLFWQGISNRNFLLSIPKISLIPRLDIADLEQLFSNYRADFIPQLRGIVSQIHDRESIASPHKPLIFYLHSPKGFGKTHFVNHLANILNLPLMTLPIQRENPGIQLFGDPDQLGNKPWIDAHGTLIKAIMTAGVLNPLIMLEQDQTPFEKPLELEYLLAQLASGGPPHLHHVHAKWKLDISQAVFLVIGEHKLSQSMMGADIISVPFPPLPWSTRRHWLSNQALALIKEQESELLTADIDALKNQLDWLIEEIIKQSKYLKIDSHDVLTEALRQLVGRLTLDVRAAQKLGHQTGPIPLPRLRADIFNLLKAATL